MRSSCHVAGNKAHRLKPRGLRRWIASVGSLCRALYATSVKTVPYTKRRRLVLFPIRLERWMGERFFKLDKRGMYGGRILQPSHPDDVRVQKIAKDIIEATRSALREDRHRGAQTAHVEKFNWEVIVVEEPIPNAYCYPGGKIVVTTGLLRASKSDAEIASAIGHEVAHAVARHCIEMVINKYFTSVLGLGISHYFLGPSRSRRREKEADYIGLLLSASAGYDPQAAPEMLERYAVTMGSRRSWFSEYRSTHPPDEERARLLSHPKVMEEALSLYRKRKTLSQTKGGFLKKIFKFILELIMKIPIFNKLLSMS